MVNSASIIGREIFGLSDKKVIGVISGFKFDRDNRTVSNLTIAIPDVRTNRVLAYDKIISIGDTFIMVSSSKDMMKVADARVIIADTYDLIGAQVFSCMGNALGPVSDFSFDEGTGYITAVSLEDGSAYQGDQIQFITDDFVFVDTSAEGDDEDEEPAPKPAKKPAKKTAAKPAAKPAPAPEPEPEPEEDEDEDEDIDEDEDEDEDYEPEPVKKPVRKTAAKKADGKDENEALVDFLVGATTTADVYTRDKSFSIPKGTVLTRDLIEEASKHNLLLMLTMSVNS